VKSVLQTCVLLAIAAASLDASAELVDRSGALLPTSEYCKSDGPFNAWLLFVPSDRELYNAWGVPSESVEIDEVDSTLVNSPISMFVVFGGCAADSAGNCQVDMRYRVLAPDGSVYAETASMEVWLAKAAPLGRTLELSVDYLKVVVEPHEQVGTYHVQTQVRDRVANKVLTLEKSFEARPIGAAL
jgi:hypothetical protein